MASRSWMAAWFLAASLLAATRVDADDRAPATAPPAPATKPAAKADAPATGSNAVTIDLRIAGLTARGCEVEVKPAYPGCAFTPQTKAIDKTGLALVNLVDVRSVSADRDCTVAVTIREPGQAVRTVYRGLRLSPAGPNAKAQMLPCFLNSPSKVATAEAEGTLKR
jgi:hypothetical protein